MKHEELNNAVKVALDEGAVMPRRAHDTDAGYDLFSRDENVRTIKKGDKISQLVMLPCYTPEIVEVDALEDTERGEDGFGSTGR